MSVLFMFLEFGYLPVWHSSNSPLFGLIHHPSSVVFVVYPFFTSVPWFIFVSLVLSPRCTEDDTRGHLSRMYAHFRQFSVPLSPLSTPVHLLLNNPLPLVLGDTEVEDKLRAAKAMGK